MTGTSKYSDDEIRFIVWSRRGGVSADEVTNQCNTRWHYKDFKKAAITYVYGKYKKENEYPQFSAAALAAYRPPPTPLQSAHLQQLPTFADQQRQSNEHQPQADRTQEQARRNHDEARHLHSQSAYQGQLMNGGGYGQVYQPIWDNQGNLRYPPSVQLPGINPGQYARSFVGSAPIPQNSAYHSMNPPPYSSQGLGPNIPQGSGAMGYHPFPGPAGHSSYFQNSAHQTQLDLTADVDELLNFESPRPNEGLSTAANASHYQPPPVTSNSIQAARAHLPQAKQQIQQPRKPNSQTTLPAAQLYTHAPVPEPSRDGLHSRPSMAPKGKKMRRPKPGMSALKPEEQVETISKPSCFPPRYTDTQEYKDNLEAEMIRTWGRRRRMEQEALEEYESRPEVQKYEEARNADEMAKGRPPPFPKRLPLPSIEAPVTKTTESNKRVRDDSESGENEASRQNKRLKHVSPPDAPNDVAALAATSSPVSPPALSLDQTLSPAVPSSPTTPPFSHDQPTKTKRKFDGTSFEEGGPDGKKARLHEPAPEWFDEALQIDPFGGVDFGEFQDFPDPLQFLNKPINKEQGKDTHVPPTAAENILPSEPQTSAAVDGLDSAFDVFGEFINNSADPLLNGEFWNGFNDFSAFAPASPEPTSAEKETTVPEHETPAASKPAASAPAEPTSAKNEIPATVEPDPAFDVFAADFQHSDDPLMNSEFWNGFGATAPVSSKPTSAEKENTVAEHEVPAASKPVASASAKPTSTMSKTQVTVEPVSASAKPGPTQAEKDKIAHEAMQRVRGRFSIFKSYELKYLELQPAPPSNAHTTPAASATPSEPLYTEEQIAAAKAWAENGKQTSSSIDSELMQTVMDHVLTTEKLFEDDESLFGDYEEDEPVIYRHS